MMYLSVGAAAGVAALPGARDYAVVLVVGGVAVLAAFEIMDYRARRKPSPRRFYCGHCLHAFEQ